MNRFVPMLAALVLFSGCGEEGEGLEPGSYDALERAAAEKGETSPQTLSADDSAASDDADAQDPKEVDAWVCIGGWCGVVRSTLKGNTLEVPLPVDPALIGMPITAVVPGVGTFTGTYR